MNKKQFIAALLIVIEVICLNATLAESELELQGIIKDKKEYLAIVNGEIIRVGDRIGNAEVIEIVEDSVKFRDGNRIFNVQFKESFKEGNRTVSHRRTIELYSMPDRFEFEVYKYECERLWDLPLGKEAEEDLARQTAKKFGINVKDVKNIHIKFFWYEMRIYDINPNYQDGDIIKMKWEEAKKWIDRIGLPK